MRVLFGLLFGLMAISAPLAALGQAAGGQSLEGQWLSSEWGGVRSIVEIAPAVKGFAASS